MNWHCLDRSDYRPFLFFTRVYSPYISLYSPQSWPDFQPCQLASDSHGLLAFHFPTIFCPFCFSPSLSGMHFLGLSGCSDWDKAWVSILLFRWHLSGFSVWASDPRLFFFFFYKNMYGHWSHFQKPPDSSLVWNLTSMGPSLKYINLGVPCYSWAVHLWTLENYPNLSRG